MKPLLLLPCLLLGFCSTPSTPNPIDVGIQAQMLSEHNQ